MAQYDGSIRINTKIDTDGFKDGEKEIEAESRRVSESVSKTVEKDANKIEKALKNLKDAQKNFLEAGGTKKSSVYQEYEKEISRLRKTLQDLQNAQYDEEIANEHWNQLKIDVEEYAKSLKELQDKGQFFGDEDYDKVYLAWKNATDAVKVYQAELNKKTESGQAKIAEQEARAAEKREAAQRRAEEQAEKALQKENARIQKEIENQAKLEAKEAERKAREEARINAIQAKEEAKRAKEIAAIQAQEQEEQRLAAIRENAVVGNQRIVEVMERRRQLAQEIADMERAGVGVGYQQHDTAKQELASLDQEIKNYANGVEEVKESYSRLGQTAKKAFSIAHSAISKAGSGLKRFGGFVKSVFSNLTKSAHKSNSSLGALGARFKSLALSLLIFNQISKAFNSMISGMKEGFGNLYKEVNGFKSAVDGLKASSLTLKNSFAAAFRPLVEIAVPYIQKVIDAIANLMNIIGQFTAAITGQKTYTKAIKQTTAAIEDENKAQNKQLSGLDKLNNLSSGSGGASDGGGSWDMFEEEVPIEIGISDATEKVKQILSNIFDVFQQAWESKGQSVIDSAKAALASLAEAAKSVGATFYDVFTGGAGFTWLESGLELLRSMLGVIGSIATAFSNAWNGGSGIEIVNAIFGALTNVNNLLASIGDSFSRAFSNGIGTAIWENILGIITGIYNTIGNLAERITVAWNTASLGNSIWSGILGIIGVIIDNIRHASDITAEWAKNIDFSPFLTKLQGWIDSLVPVFDTLSGVVKDFYEKVLLPLGKWTIEKGLPELLRIMTDFNNKVDWESIRKRLSEFWEHLEPFAETIGEGLLIFIDKLSRSLADFVNSPAFESFLSTIENWMDNVSPEDVANGLEIIRKAILGYKALSAAFGVISFGAGAISKLVSALKFFGVGGGAEKVSSAMGTTGDAASGMGESFGSLPGIVGKVVNGIGFLGVGIQSLQQVSKHASMDEIFNATSDALTILEQKYKDGAISIEEYRTEADKLVSVSEMAMMKNDSESISAFNEALAELNQKLNQTGENMDLFGAKAVETGNNITTGLTVGIENVDVENSTQGIFEKIISTIKTLFGIHSPSTVMEEIGNFLMEGLHNGISGLVDKVISTFTNTKDKITETWGWINEKVTGTTKGLSNDVAEKFGYMKEKIAETWRSSRESTDTELDGIKKTVNGTTNELSSNVSGGFGVMKSEIKKAWSSANESTADEWNSINRNVSGNLESLEGSSRGTFGNIATHIRDTWQNVKSNTQSSMDETGRKVINTWNESQRNTAQTWDSMKSTVVSSASSMETTMNSRLTSMKGNISSFSSNTKTMWSTTYDNIKTKNTASWSEISQASNNAMRDVGNTVSHGMNQAKNTWGSIWDSIFEKVRDILGSIQDAVSSAMNAISGMISNINGALDNLFAKAESASKISVSSKGGSGGSGGKKPRMADPRIEALAETPIPRLATGTVVPPNNEFLAVLGDNKREPEVVSPLSTIEQAVENAMRRNGGTGGVKELTIHVPVEIDGRVLFELIRKLDLEQYNRTQRPSFQM